VTSSLNDRFEQEGVTAVRNIENCLIAAANGDETKMNTAALSFPFIDNDLLQDEVRGLSTVIKLFNATADVKLREVTTVSTLYNVFNSLPSAKVASPQIHKLLKLYGTMPLSTASCERAFSVMRRVKSWVRANLGQNGLNNVMFAHIHKQLMDEVDFDAVAKEFVTRSDARRRYFGSFD
jgi:hypothetical protein